MANFRNSKAGLRNRFVLGPMQAVRASVVVSYEWDYETEQEIEVESPGSAHCLTEVIEWPFSEDEAGVSFPGNLYGVRTRCWRQPLADGGGDMDWWTAVPKTLPSGYTLVPRYGGTYSLISGFYHDYIGDDPMAGFSWNLRTAGGVLLDLLDSEQSARAQWSPMNLNQQCYNNSSPAFFWMGDVEGHGDYYLALLAQDHIGFRGGLATLTSSQGVERSGEMEIWGHPVTGTYVDDAVLIDSVTLTAPPRISPPVGEPGPIVPSVTEVSLPAMLPTSDGIRWNFYGKITPSDWINELATVGKVFQLSPRVDVPLFYCASMGNRVSPGGIILP